MCEGNEGSKAAEKAVEGYEAVIGLEVHVELATRTKIFCGCSTAFGGRPNAHTCPVCTGMPGALPVLNRKVLEYAVAVGLAANCTITRFSRFDRKNYFYPDNPQNYQISQLYLPICRDGYIEIELERELPSGGESDSAEETFPAEKSWNSAQKRIRIHEIHMEEDAGKLTHDEQGGCTLVDYNRAGVPLIEIVTQPDMGSAREVVAFLEKLRLIIRYLGAGDCRLQEGSMRVDVNLSVRPRGAREMGTRTEMKNLGSFHGIEMAIESERNRQTAILESGGAVIQETRRWDEEKGISHPMRSKEEARDYRYFPEPDLVPVVIGEDYLERIRAAQPEMAWEKRQRFLEEYPIPEYDIRIITASRRMSDIFEAAVVLGSPPKKVSNWLMGETLRLLKEKGQDSEEIRFSPENLAKLIALVENRVISTTVAKEVFAVLFEEDMDPVEYVEKNELKTAGNQVILRRVAEEVIASNHKSAEDYRGGKDRALGYLVGQVMKALKGKADPVQVKEQLKELL